jgi:hypothetical protein
MLRQLTLMNDVASRPRGLLPGLAVSETVSWGICFYGFARIDSLKALNSWW